MRTCGSVASSTICRTCRRELIDARSGVDVQRSTMAPWSGRAGAALEPLYEAHKRFVLQARVHHAGETSVAMPDRGRGRTKKAYVYWSKSGRPAAPAALRARAKVLPGRVLLNRYWSSQFVGRRVSPASRRWRQLPVHAARPTVDRVLGIAPLAQQPLEEAVDDRIAGPARCHIGEVAALHRGQRPEGGAQLA